ncbi:MULTISPECIES: chorismate-binding protein [Thermodesulfovibrio]|jgi:para-aminobenzoate synthetase component 1|uniref:chorismate-binding protein n=1 Tax=Thermodesulfovibrio TaxID=28261 RepID=UPI00260C0B8D|nr:anthranilate synthase component I family protein [Thermodesulfovibrio sp.]
MLILSGKWLGRDGFYEAQIDSILFYRSLAEIDKIEPNSFVIFSYDLAKETLGVHIKKSPFPTVVIVKTTKFNKLSSFNENYSLSPITNSLRDEEFMDRVSEIRRLIENGTVYQINLTNRFDFELNGSPLGLFFDFYRKQPVPFGFFLSTSDFFILSGSMELFLEKRCNKIISKPIKGTSKCIEELRESLKDKAENLMITDMMRNDLGRICHFGSVRTTELFKITKYKTLYQMHSTVEGLTDSSIVDVIKGTFPPASVTGAPKRKAVELIDLLEPHFRGYYCGAAGLVRESGDFALSVLIRTAIGMEKKLSYYAGCGIVWDSLVEKEIKELYLKVKAFYEFKK